MWKKVAEELKFNIPDEHIDEISPVLDALLKSVRQALDRDLSTTDPVITFRPDGQ